MSINSVTQSITASSGTASATASLADNYDNFITLLVAQVQNQDPLAPMESTEFVSQLAQLTQVEQSVQVNQHMEALRQQLALNGALSETNLIGRSVTVPSSTIALGEFGAQFSYELAKDATTVQAQIYNAAGKLVKVIDNLNGTAGKLNDVEWDGRGDDGTTYPNGQYTLSIAAVSADGKAGMYNSYSAGTVLSVDYAAGNTYLRLSDGRSVLSGEIIRAQ